MTSAQAPSGRVLISMDRPRFPTAEAWAHEAQRAIELGREPWGPATRAELLLAAELFPARLCNWLPSPRNLRLLGLAEDFGHDPEPFDDVFMQRFFATIEANEVFTRAVFRKGEAVA